MKFFINFLPLLLVIIGVLNYMYFAKDIVSTVVLLSLGVIVSIFNLIKKEIYDCFIKY
ncbi:cbb3-type cytochrome oxidase subunit 3 [Metabacillus niabensis]|uniref:Cbb3-type cytochrome oxidase subunit 3 n=1 Tax=Metabacillus niabensis TaxID=324854 RepID=A0ABT9Z2X5_9BACI|nr:cbb3-type cytochrome oxidase subunit 3 [Metabacillus niabensis]